MRAAFLMTIGLLGFSCSAINPLEFHVSAIDSNEKEIPCIIVFDDQVVVDAQNEPVLTPAWVILPFNAERSEEKIGVRPVLVSAQGTKRMVKPLGDGEMIPYLEDSRLVRPSDARRQLFVLRVNKPIVK